MESSGRKKHVVNGNVKTVEKKEALHTDSVGEKDNNMFSDKTVKEAKGFLNKLKGILSGEKK